jgi:trimeric autotransporter adhesin
MSTADRLAIAAPKGLLVFDTTTNSFWYCDSLVGSSRAWSHLAKGDYWSRNGNTVNDYNFIGTWNNKPLQIRVNGSNNTAIGSN